MWCSVCDVLRLSTGELALWSLFYQNHSPHWKAISTFKPHDDCNPLNYQFNYLIAHLIGTECSLAREEPTSLSFAMHLSNELGGWSTDRSEIECLSLTVVLLWRAMGAFHRDTICWCNHGPDISSLSLQLSPSALGLKCSRRSVVSSRTDTDVSISVKDYLRWQDSDLNSDNSFTWSFHTTLLWVRLV